MQPLRAHPRYCRTESKRLFRAASIRGTGYPVSNNLVRVSCLNPLASLTANREVTVAYLRADDTTEQARVDTIFVPADEASPGPISSLHGSVAKNPTKSAATDLVSLHTSKVLREWVVPHDIVLSDSAARDARTISEETERSTRTKRHHLDRRSDRDDLSSSPYR